MNFIAWAVFGLLAGLIAKPALPGPNAGGLAVALPLGIASALLGGWMGSLSQFSTKPGFDYFSLIMAMNASLITLFVYRCYAMSIHTRRKY